VWHSQGVLRASALLLASLLVACGGSPENSGDGVIARPDTGVADGPIEDLGVEPPDTAAPETPPTICDLRPACATAPPDPGPKGSFRHWDSGRFGGPNHRGRDLFLKPGQTQWALAKFAYGAPTPDDDLKDEDVDVWLLRDCAGSWEKLGTYRTTEDGAHSTEEGVVDTGGRIYVNLTSTLTVPLGVGRHRLHYVVRGDLSKTDQYIEVLPEGAKIVVTDIDGTLSSSESASWSEAFGGTPPGANPGSPEALTTLAKRGYYIFYLTARPEFFVQKTRDWLKDKGFPLGIVHTSFSHIGETGSSAIDYKSAELLMLKDKTGIVPAYGFGNTASDTNSYDNAKIMPASNRYFFKYNTDLKGGTYHDDYTKLVPAFSSLPITSCPAPAK